MKSDPLDVKLLILQRLPFSEAVTPADTEFFASSITKLMRRGRTADYIALQLCRIHTNVLDQPFAGKSYLELAAELVSLVKPDRRIEREK